MKNLTKTHQLLILFVLILLARVGLFYTVFDNVRAGAASYDFASGAIGFIEEGRFSVVQEEYPIIAKLKYHDDIDFMKDVKQEQPRQLNTYMLPGTAFLLATLWKITGIYNFQPFIYFNILVDLVLILLFFLAFRRIDKKMAFTVSLLMAVNIIHIHKVLTMGYDFAPIFAVVSNIIGGVYILRSKKHHLPVLLMMGLASGVVVWFRAIVTLLPFFVAIALMIIFWKKYKNSLPVSFGKVACYMAPIILSVTLLSMYRYDTTGSYRPTRSTFWHSFFAGVAQFDNPYGIKSLDEHVWALGIALNPDLVGSNLIEQSQLPNSPYEETLKEEGKKFIKEHPFLFIRNGIYRVGIMISPTFYDDGRFLPASFFPVGFGLGIITMVLWLIGMKYIFDEYRYLFVLMASIFLYFFLALGGFYIVGRVIVTFMVLNLIAYLYGAKFLLDKFKSRRSIAATKLTTVE